MWRMRDGDRVLTEVEWEVFATGLDMLRSQVEADISAGSDDTDTGVRAFDRLTAEQKLGLLAAVARAVRDPDIPIPRHTAANEGAIMAIVNSFEGMLQAEIELNEKGRTDLRRCLLAACAGADDLPAARSANWAEWEFLCECFADRLLWDRDFELGDVFLDLPSNVARSRLHEAGIDPDYFLDIPAEPGEAGLVAARQELARLLDLPVPDDDGLYPTLNDLYHDLFVGPVRPGEADTWADHPWLRVVQAIEPSWDCEIPTWHAEFAGAIPATPFEVPPACAADDIGPLPEDVRVERAGDGWVVRMADGAYWEGLVENGWADAPDEDSPALTFPTEADAVVAFLRANRMYEDRAARHEAALARLDELDEAAGAA